MYSKTPEAYPVRYVPGVLQWTRNDQYVFEKIVDTVNRCNWDVGTIQ